MSEIRKKIVGEIREKLQNGVIMTDSNGTWRRESQIVDALREVEEAEDISTFSAVDKNNVTIHFDGNDFFVIDRGRIVRALDTQECRVFLRWLIQRCDQIGVHQW